MKKVLNIEESKIISPHPYSLVEHVVLIARNPSNTSIPIWLKERHVLSFESDITEEVRD